MAKNSNMHAAKKNQNDEFYTQLADIESEVMRYKDQFKGKVVFCNCDDPAQSNFWKFFELNFDNFGLKKLMSTHFDENQQSYKLEIIGDIDGDGKVTSKDIVKTPLKQNGDFRSDECVELLKEADIVCTNPPFSLFREYIEQLVEHKKKFLIVGNPNAITYKEVFKLIKDKKLWLGIKSLGTDMLFGFPDSKKQELLKKKEGSGWKTVNGKIFARASACWFTNLEIKKKPNVPILIKKYNPKDYPQYDNYSAINVNKIKDIPYDYQGVIGVPITILGLQYSDGYIHLLDELSNEMRYMICSCNDYIINNQVKKKESGLVKDKDSAINGKATYARVLIKKI